MTVNAYPPGSPSAPPPPPQAPAKSSGCLKWALIGCGAALVLGVAFVAILTMVVFGAIKHSDVYREALRRAQNDPAVIAALGTPIEAGFYATGSVNVNNGAGNANVDFPISGPKGKATVHAVATKNGSAWEYSEMKVTPAGGSVINILPAPSPASSSDTPSSTGTAGTDSAGTESTTAATDSGSTASTSS